MGRERLGIFDKHWGFCLGVTPRLASDFDVSPSGTDVASNGPVQSRARAEGAGNRWRFILCRKPSFRPLFWPGLQP